MRPTAVIDLVGLSPSLLGPHAPNLRRLVETRGARRLAPDLPAVTCTVQSSMLTGRPVREHGIVANGWFDRELAEVHFWKQSNRLVHGEKVWHAARRRDPAFTCANLFWWFNMATDADVSVTPRPIYKADGRKLPDCYADPPAWRDRLQAELGPFPLFSFWGPMAGIESSTWICEASLRVHEEARPSLLLVYLPHLDYGLQRVGPDHPSIPDEVAALDRLVGRLETVLAERGVRTIWLSEYGIEAADRPVFPNRALREAGLLRVRDEDGLEQLDPVGSPAFAVADHQVAHVYVADAGAVGRVRGVLEALDGVEAVLDDAGRTARGIDHPRAGELLLVAARGAWFAHDHWLDDARAPDFARTVDIHRKPGYDPRELHLDPARPFVKGRIAWRLLQRRLGMRALLDVIPLDATLVRGTHGRTEQPAAEQPMVIPAAGDAGWSLEDEPMPCTGVHDLVLASLFGED